MAGLLGTCREQVTSDDVAILISGEHYDGNSVPGDGGGGEGEVGWDFAENGLWNLGLKVNEGRLQGVQPETGFLKDPELNWFNSRI